MFVLQMSFRGGGFKNRNSGGGGGGGNRNFGGRGGRSKKLKIFIYNIFMYIHTTV